jgi:hypothetical protein
MSKELESAQKEQKKIGQTSSNPNFDLAAMVISGTSPGTKQCPTK